MSEPTPSEPASTLSARTSAAPSCVIFVHIPKTAGQTLSAILARQYHPSNVLTIKDRDDLMARFGERSRQRVPKLIWGHVPFGIHESLGINATYITMLRDPVARVISTFGYIRRNPKHPFHRQVREMDLEDFIDSDIDRRDVVNGQTRQLAGSWDSDPDEATLELAKRNLSRFAVVGLTERFDESLIILRQKVGWRLPFYVSKNVGSEKALSRPLTPHIHGRLKDQNALDFDLYRFGEALFEREVRKAGPRLRFEVLLLRSLNPIARWYRGTIPRGKRANP